MVARAPFARPQAARHRRRAHRLRSGAQGGAADQSLLPRGNPFHGGMDRAPLPRRSGDGVDALRPRRRRRGRSDSPSRVPSIGAAALSRRSAEPRICERNTRPRRAIRPPITVNSPAPGSATTTSSKCASAGAAGGSTSDVVRAAEMLYKTGEGDLAMAFATDVGQDINDPAVVSGVGRVTARYKDAQAMLQLGKAALGRGMPMDHYAFPDVGVPATPRSLRSSTAASSTRSRAPKAASIPATSRRRRRSG